MKKMFGILACAALVIAGCNEANAEKKSAQVETASTAAAAKVAVAAPADEPTRASVSNVDWARALEMQKAGAVVIDVRTSAEVSEGMAPDALNIPMQEAEARIAEFPKDKDLLIYCRSGKRSMAVSNFLVQNGYTRVFNVVGGFLAFPR